MSSQFDMFDVPVEQEAVRSNKDKVIRCQNLIHSIVDCHKVEDAIWQRLDLAATRSGGWEQGARGVRRA